VCAAVVFSSLSYAVTSDRIQGALAGSQKVALRGNVHGLARPGSDIGRVDGNRLIQGVSLDFRPSPEQQKDLDQFIAQLGDRNSPNYHKYLTPKQFGERFGLSRNDIQKIKDWLQSQGFTNIRVANGRNRISFDGTIAQVESSFNTEFHHYLIDSELHFANATDVSVPAAMAQAVIGVGNINTFRPKPRARPVAHFTSSSSGNHFLTPDDFATIYNLQPLYDAGADGSGQTIAVVGQTALITSDLDHFRTAAGLTQKNLTQTLIPDTGASTVFDSDLVESDLDVEWAGGVAKNANINFVYVGANQNASVWDSLQHAVSANVAAFITTSYGFCEAGLGSTFADTVRGWATQAISQGQTIVAASGDAGAADCEAATNSSATTGLAVDIPASIPEVTGMGGTTFSADAPTCTTPCPPGGNPPYWAAAGTGIDTLSSALEYIPETAWNDTVLAGQLSSSGGGVSTFFAKPSWQTGTGVPDDGQRDVPDVSLTATPNHDGYLFCSQTVPGSGLPSCTNGFRDSQGSLDVVGGTSAGSPSFAAILALINQYLGNSALDGLAPVNPTLYGFASSNPAVFHDVKTGDNKVPCNSGTPDCPTGTTSIGFSAGVGYDQVTGLGSVDAFALAQAWAATPRFQLSPAAASYQVHQGSSVTADVNFVALNGFPGTTVTYTCSDDASESTCTGPTGAVDVATPASFTITTKAPIAKLDRPSSRGSGIFYATLFPGLLGLVFVAASSKRSLRGIRLLGLLLMLGFSTMWLGSCGGSSGGGVKDPGTPTGTYTIIVAGTSGSVVQHTTFQLVVVP